VPDLNHRRLVKIVRELVAAEKADREPYYRAAAEKIVDLRAVHKDGELPDWAGRSPDYKAAMRLVYRDAGGVPQSIQASIRYHVNNLLRERLTPEELDAAGLDRASSKQKMRGEAPTRTRKPRQPAPLPAETLMVSRALGDPVALVTQAVRALEAAADLKPSGDAAATVRLLLRSVRDAADHLAAVIVQHEDSLL
jgi:hypothetical protein